MKTVFVLEHSYEDESHEDIKLIGVYSSEERARATIEQLRGKPGFRKYPDSFHVSAYPLDHDHWTEGFGGTSDEPTDPYEVVADWIIRENVQPFMIAYGRLLGAVPDLDELEVIRLGVLRADAEADRWYEHSFWGVADDRARIRLAPDPGSSVMHVRATVPPEFVTRMQDLISVFQSWVLTSAVPPASHR